MFSSFTIEVQSRQNICLVLDTHVLPLFVLFDFTLPCVETCAAAGVEFLASYEQLTEVDYKQLLFSNTLNNGIFMYPIICCTLIPP